MAIYGIAAFYDIDLISLQHKMRIILIFMLSYIKHKQATNLQRHLWRGLRYTYGNNFWTGFSLYSLIFTLLFLSLPLLLLSFNSTWHGGSCLIVRGMWMWMCNWMLASRLEQSQLKNAKCILQLLKMQNTRCDAMRDGRELWRSAGVKLITPPPCTHSLYLTAQITYVMCHFSMELGNPVSVEARVWTCRKWSFNFGQDIM